MFLETFFCSKIFLLSFEQGVDSMADAAYYSSSLVFFDLLMYLHNTNCDYLLFKFEIDRKKI